MKNTMRRTLALAGISILAATVFAAPAANAATTAPAPTTIQVTPSPAPTNVPSLDSVSGKLTPKEKAAVAAGDPLTITVDAQSGEIEKVAPISSVQIFAVGVKTNCAGVTGCYYGTGVPYVDYGFTAVGSGTATGNWPGRSSYGSQTRYVSACSTATCYVKASPKQLVVFNGPVTGTSFTIY
ncbi:hypothetical protein [Arthrobacter sp. ERGS1:01]|uniref:hypothetical protein n=1 Tax=Arthrobacter sp. ERGS1:01 TaxID=1704044 RepID=UPI0012377EE2|nr:hypothetical protein [Arthrobacter sp. ERGS1:01]